jgi:hypothetical protein
MFKIFHLGVLKFGFFSFCHFCTKNANFTFDSKTTSFLKRRNFNFEVRSKIDIPL